MKRSYSDAQLEQAVGNSTSIRQVLRHLGLVEAGGNYVIVKRNIGRLKLSTTHFKGQGWRKGHSSPVVSAKSLSEIFSLNSGFQSHKLKRRILSEGLKERRCEGCQRKEWSGQLIPLELHHINGMSQDNRFENLQLLCPNCHALTESYRGKKLAKCRDETAPS